MQKVETEALLKIKDIRKSFGSNEVLKGINLELNEGEVVALIGGNGAGKSTLMKIIMGIYQQDAGDLFIHGVKTDLSKSSLALANGIYLVPQEPMLFPNMTVEENIAMGFNENKIEMHKKIVDMIAHLGWDLKLDRRANTLSIAEQQLVEILKGLLRESRILIFDEPTSSLSFNEAESLFELIEDLKKKNIGIFYITHRLSEVFEIATHVAIMRDGIVSLSGAVSEFDKSHLVKALLPPGSELKTAGESTAVDYSKAKPMLELKDFSGYGFSGLNFEVYPGEILGVAGVVGAGRTEFATTIFGMDKVKGGKVLLDGEDITGMGTRKVLDKGINYVPEDRFLNGIFKIRETGWNISSAQLRNMSKIFLNKKAEKELADKYINDFRIKVTSQDQLMGSLSGGNQQKAVIARALSTNPKVVILDEPTRGIDAGARGDVYSIIGKLKQQGVAVLLISSDLEEIVELSDRAISMYQGRINHTFPKEKIDLDNLTAASFGVYEEGE
ncbi:sugar ABC transporter ATP-binding protein [Hespellia stercorisuis]|uniref:Autoinducer 2 import ATP-binding protein LsrA n=1 Tax=Hespellia stercorisuis DSM 15480 TaxID=1121950 RepID=A0A1M6J5K7_9FIRM|nr:sugar ABC transporter ATP-binding protein [Hespellia stercorisuis]SHJ41966.1 AI-2 transport system ATP-binding protein [Hespellia stercorisuis DSM 15480]